MPEEFLLERVADVHQSEPYRLRKFVRGRERMVIDGEEVPIDYFFAMVPLDCIDDVSKPDRYNPRHLKEDHRDSLMAQIGTYGLVYPLVATVEATNGTQRLLLIDGRHRYWSLLELDSPLKQAIVAKALAAKKARRSTSISDPERLRPPRHTASSAIQQYDIDREGEGLSPMVPVKVYLNQDEVDRIGMAVFLNRGQKKLHGGEQIEKIWKALEEALREEVENEESPSEKRAVDKVLKANVRADYTLVVLSRHVADVMDDEESPWFPLIARWQGEVAESEDDPRRKPLTASNFLAFVSEIVDATPQERYDEKRRRREIENLNRLGKVFATEFDWPADLPSKDAPYTATAVLSRSFLVRAIGAELNAMYAEETKFLSRPKIPETVWTAAAEAVAALRVELQKQAKLREKFEKLKKALNKAEPGSDREEILVKTDALRGQLWTLDTITITLRNRLRDILPGAEVE